MKKIKKCKKCKEVVSEEDGDEHLIGFDKHDNPKFAWMHHKCVIEIRKEREDKFL